MNTRKLTTTAELYDFVIINSPLDILCTALFWPYLKLWCWISLVRYTCVGWFEDDKLIGVMVYKGDRMYYLGVSKPYRHKGLALKMFNSSGCSEFCVVSKRMKEIARHYGFKQVNFWRFVKDE